jgi:hypothetical protein
VNQAAFRVRRIERERGPQLVQGDQRSDHGRPQAGEQKDAACSLDPILSDRDGRSERAKERAYTEIDESDTDAKPQQQEAEPGPAIRKSREKTLQSASQDNGMEFAPTFDTLQSAPGHPSFGGYRVRVNLRL